MTASTGPRWLRYWRRGRLLIGLLLLGYGLYLVAPVVLPGLLQQSAPGRLVAVFSDPTPDGERQLQILFEYRIETANAVTINLGHQLAGPTGEPIAAPVLGQSAFDILSGAIDQAGGPDQLPCRVFYGGGEPRIYCPLLVGDRRRWQRGVISLAIPVVLLLSSLLHGAVTAHHRREPRPSTGV